MKFLPLAGQTLVTSTEDLMDLDRRRLLRYLQSYSTRIMKIACGIFLIFFSVSVAAQFRTADTGAVCPPFQWNDSLMRRADSRFPVNGMLLPAALIAYGFLTPHLDGLTDLNENVKYDVWTKRSHKTIPYDTYLQFVPAVAVYGLNWTGIRGRNDFVDRSMIYFISNVIMGVSVYALKNATHVQRPDGSGYDAFPSGHTAEAFLSAEFLRQEYADRSAWYGVGGYAVAGTVAYMRLYNNKHWLNDVVAGAGFGIASTHVAYWLYPKIRKAFYHAVFRKSVLLPYYQSGGAGLAFNYNLP